MIEKEKSLLTGGAILQLPEETEPAKLLYKPEDANIEIKIPANAVSPVDRIRRILEQEVIGQPRAIEAVCRALLRAESGLRNPARPIAVLFFAGPTGVGKTETVRALAKALHNDWREMIKIDCSEYSEPHAISRLVGSPPGYIGSDLPVIFSREAIEGIDKKIILFDEIEKAHWRLHNLLLQIMDEGRITLARRTKDDNGIIDMSHTIIILTSNVGGTDIEDVISNNRIGFKTGEKDPVKTDQEVYLAAKQAMKRAFSPEFRNRITDFIVFRALPREALFKILEKLLRQTSSRLAALGVSVMLTDRAKSFLVDRGLDLELGVRPLVKKVEHYIESKIAEFASYKVIQPGDFIVADVATEDGQNEHLIFKRAPRKRSKK